MFEDLSFYERCKPSIDPTPNHWGEECSGRCREGNSGGSWLGTIQNSLGDLQSLTVVSLRRKDAQGCTRGKRAFGQRMQDELVLTSLRGLEMAKSTMKYLGGDMFFKKWSMPLIPWSQLPVMKYDDYLKLFAVDQTLDISSRRFGLGGAWKWS